LVADRVVDRAEPVDVHEQQAGAQIQARALGQRFVEPLEQGRAVRNAGQLVGIRELLNAGVVLQTLERAR
jgi:hypothetical protein